MSISLNIKGFKKIEDEIQLTDLSAVNYLVGKNGSGKTSILNAIALLNDERLAQPYLRDENSLVRLIIDNDDIFIKYNSSIQNGAIVTNGELKFKCYIERSSTFSGLNAEVTQLKFDTTFESIRDDDKDNYFNYLNTSLTELGFDSIEQKNEGNKWTQKIGFYQNNKKIELPLLAQGALNINNLNYILNVVSTDFTLNEYLKRYRNFFVLLEEPENNLHPKLQKEIPTILDNFLNNLPNNVKGRVNFIIATHSPFIIGASSNFKNQKCYILENGCLLDKDSNMVSSSPGYWGSECAWAVSQMLGSDVVDFGYPENYCILEENSLQKILDNAKAKGIIKNIQFVSGSGWSRAESLGKMMEGITNLNTLIKCNPYYSDKYLMILDNLNDISGPTEKNRISAIRNRLGNRFCELNNNSLEEYYQNINPALYRQAQNDIEQADKSQKGIIKDRYANQIADLINSRSDFSTLFNGELDFLLR